MNLEKLNPWNWIKHEESQGVSEGSLPVTRESNPMTSRTMGGNPVQQLHQEVNRLFDNAFRDFGLPSTLWDAEGFRPSLDICSDERKYMITLEAPGMEEKDLSLELRDDVLLIKGDKKEEKEEKGQHYYRMERRFGTFQRVLALPQDAVSESIEANMKDGVLSINIARREADQSNVKKIAISS